MLIYIRTKCNCFANFLYYFYIILVFLGQNRSMKKWIQVLLLILLGVLVGFVNGFLGAGGGMLLVPCIIPILKMDTKVAHATAILIILPICVVSGIIYAIQGSFEFDVFLPCLIG
ncbi:MAG: sulfite exporter TauE/SafE family protein, partial [Clostridia bacterium]|nr:sulfite exporter TauE/SafE family protein [Clostridia bacterium]